MKKTNVFVIAALAAVLTSCGGGSGAPSFGDNEYPVATVGTSDASTQVTFPATLKGIQDVEVRPKIAGFITKVCVKEGQAVGAGQLLFVIDNETYQAAVRQAQASVNTATAQCNTSKLTYENTKKLHEQGIVGDFELQSAKNSYDVALASVSQAKAALASARETLSFCYVKSPASGIIGELPYKVGAMVSASSTPALTTVSNNSTIEAYFSMTEKEVLELSKNAGGMAKAIENFPSVKLQLADGTIYGHEGRVAKASGVVDATTGSVQVIARFSNPERLLKSGASGNIILSKNSASAIVIPMSATTEVQNKVFVYVVGKDNKVKYTEIKVDPQNDGTNYIVTDGLRAGDQYVTNGLTKLTDGAEIKPITKEQYEKKIKEAEKMGEANGSAKGFVDAMKK